MGQLASSARSRHLEFCNITKKKVVVLTRVSSYEIDDSCVTYVIMRMHAHYIYVIYLGGTYSKN